MSQIGVDPYNVNPGYGGDLASGSTAAYMSSGASSWGMDTSLRSNPWDAPYRPDRYGPSAYSAYRRPGFLGAIGNVVSPLRRDPIWGNPVDNYQPSYDAIGSKPFDAAGWTGQRVITPLVMSLLATKALSGVGTTLGSSVFGGVAQGLGLGGGLGAGAAGLGGFLGGMLLPAVAGYYGTKAVSNLAFKPYTEINSTAEALRYSTGNIAYDMGGSVLSGRGLSARTATRIGSQIQRAGVDDMTFTSSEYHGIARISAQLGLLDDVTSSQMVDRIKGIAQQIKLVMTIAKDPSWQNALQDLAKLKMGGASIAGGAGSQAMRAYSTIASSASVAGVSVQELMSGVGMQGQYMYQAAGLTPYLGQIAAANVYSGFASAHRAGMISDAQLARMGGIEGATQSAVGARVATAQSLFGRMQAYNTYLGGRRGGAGSVVDTVSTFSANVVDDPVSAAGRMALHGNTAISSLLSDNGSGLTESTAAKFLRSAGVRPAGAGGKFTPEQIAAGLTGMGLSQDQVVAYLQSRATQTDPGSKGMRMAGIGASYEEMSRQEVSQNTMYGGSFGTSIRLMRKASHSVANVLGDPAARFSARRGSFIDSVSNALDYYLYGSSVTRDFSPGDSGMSMDWNKAVKTMSGGVRSAGKRGAYSELYAAIASNFNSNDEMGDLARKIANPATSQDERRKALVQFSRKMGGSTGRTVEGLLNEDAGAANEILSGLTKETVSISKQANLDSSREDLARIRDYAGGKDLTDYDSLQLAGQAQSLIKEVSDKGLSFATEGLSLLSDPKYAALAARFEKMGYSDSMKLGVIKDLARQSMSSGYARSAFIAGSMATANDLLSGKVSPADVTSDKDLQAKLAAAVSRKDLKAISDLMLQVTAKTGTGSLKGKGRVIRKYDSITDMASQMPSELASVEALKREAGESDSADVDFSSMWSNIKDGIKRATTSDLGAASEKIDEGAAKILEAAKIFERVMSGASGGPSANVRRW